MFSRSNNRTKEREKIDRLRKLLDGSSNQNVSFLRLWAGYKFTLTLLEEA
jgi:hypothetical protein